jgi:uncharacterized protein (TIRG00374 family)
MNQKTEIRQVFSKKRIYLAIFFCFSIVGFIYWRELTNHRGEYQSLNWTGKAFLLLSCGLLMMVFRDLAYIIRIRLLTDKKLSWKQAFQVIMLWEFASALSPGVVGGSAAALFILEKEKIPLGKSTALVIITLILDHHFYVIIIPLVFIFVDLQAIFPTDLAWMRSGLFWFWIAYGVLFTITLILALSVFYSPKIIASLVHLIYKLPFLRKRKANANKFSADIEIASHALQKKPAWFWLQLFGTTVWSWVSRFLVLNFVLYAFIELQLMDHLIILTRQLLMWLALLVSPTPGGSGMAEFAFSKLFADYVRSGAGYSAIGLALIWRTLSYYPYLLIGSIVLPIWLRR